MDHLPVPPEVSPDDMRKARAWVGYFLAAPANLPISFQYDGQPVKGIPANWNPVKKRRRMDANLIETVFEGNHPATGLTLRVECLEYLDYPVVEWVAWFTNQGSQPTPILADVLAIDSDFAGASPVLYHCNGDFYNEVGYTPEETPLAAGEMLAYAPNGGRSCDGAFPYYRLIFEDCGLTMAIGWPGQWSASFRGLEQGVHVCAGQQKTHLRLQPGESIRTPRITLLSWMGDQARAVNLWRRWYLAHILPRSNGQPLTPKLALCGPEEGEEFTAATQDNQLYNIAKFGRLGFKFDVWWIDAGWYPCYNAQGERRWWITGNWYPDPERFPVGMAPVSQRAAQDGADLLVWFEPERIQPGTWLDRERSSWLLRAAGNDNSLLNLGNPQCRVWLTDHICQLIQENGIKIYRQDFNFEPLEHWRSNDAPDRQGMNENLHIQGYLQYWDDLLERNPGLWIDSCSSGGRRNDLETMRRSVPLHFTDYGYGIHSIKLAFHHTLYAWIPYFKDVTLSWDIFGVERFDRQVDRFSYHCGMVPMLFAAIDIRRDDYDIPLALEMIAIWRRAADLILTGDYYPLTPFHRSAAQWTAFQFDQPASGRGLIQAFRLQECPQEAITLYPKGLLAEALYRLENSETGETREVAGAELLQSGLTVALPQRSAVIWFYERKG